MKETFVQEAKCNLLIPNKCQSVISNEDTFGSSSQQDQTDSVQESSTESGQLAIDLEQATRKRDQKIAIKEQRSHFNLAVLLQ